MNLFALVISFGGGIIGVYMRAFSTSISTGVIVIAGAVAAVAEEAGMTAGFIASGSYLGPHIVFAGGMTTFIYAGKTKKLGSGTDILSCLSRLTDPATLLVGDVLGMIGFLVHYVIGAVLHLNTDLPGSTVIISVVVARLVFGSSGLIGEAAPGETREHFTGGKGVLCSVILDSDIGTITGFVYQALVDGRASAASIGSYPVLCFGIAVVSLTFTQTGLAMPATHYIALTPALVVVTAQNPVMGIIFGILTSLFGDSIGKTFSSCYDTYIDPPAFTIFVFTFIVNVLFGSGFFSI